MFEYLCFTEHTWPTPDEELRLDYSDGKLYFKHTQGFVFPEMEGAYGKNRMRIVSLKMSSFPEMEGTYGGNLEEFVKKLEDLHIENWKKEYFGPVLDGHGWDLSYKEVGKKTKHMKGSNAYPENYEDFHALIYSILCEEMNGQKMIADNNEEIKKAFEELKELVEKKNVK